MESSHMYMMDLPRLCRNDLAANTDYISEVSDDMPSVSVVCNVSRDGELCVGKDRQLHSESVFVAITIHNTSSKHVTICRSY